MKINYEILYTKRKKTSLKKKEPWSLVEEPIDKKEDRLQGNTRDWGDANKTTQKKVIDLIVEMGQENKLSEKEIFAILAIARVESGYNPDAANLSSSAGGIGQFINDTAKSYNIESSDKRFDAKSAIQALIDYSIYNKNLGLKHGLSEDEAIEMIYGYHHGGKKPDEEGTRIVEEIINPLVKKLEEYNQKHSKHVVVVEESETGRNIKFLDTIKGITMSKDQFIMRINAGEYPGYLVQDIHEVATPVSNPDKTAGNNLG